MEVRVSRLKLQPILFAALAVVLGAGLAVEVLKPIYRLKSRSGVVPLLSLSYEKNIPTWYSSALLLACSLVLALIATGAHEKSGFRRYWWGLAAAFLYISLDEIVEIHEAMSGWLALGGVFYFSWVIPAGIVVAAFAIAYLRFLAHLPRRRRSQFVVAGGIYVAGALLMDLPLGYWTEREGTNNIVYALIDFVEESMEMLGVNLFLLSLVEHLGADGSTVSFLPREGERRAADGATPRSAAEPDA